MPHSSSQRFVLVGNESLLIQCAERLRERGCAVAAVVTSRSALRRWAAGQGVRVLRDVAALREARDLQPFDYLVSVTNLSVLGADVLALPTRGAINFHDGPLPEYAGLNTPVWALLEGAATHGITWHLMTAEVDRGDILVERRFAIDADETSLTINTKNYEAGYEAFEELLDGLVAGTLVPRRQDRPIERYFGRRDRPAAMASIDWRASALDAVRLVRALDFGTYANPVASAKVSLRGRALRVVKAVVAGPVAARDAFVALQGFETLDGRVLTAAQAAAYWTLGQTPMVGQRLDTLDAAMRARLSEINARVAPHESFWLRRLESRDDIELAYVDRKAKAAEPRPEHVDTLVEGGEEHRRAELLALVWLLLARLADKDGFDVGFRDEALAKLTDGGCDWFATQVPLRAQLDFGASFEALTQAAAAELDNVTTRGTFARDAIGRTPELRLTPLQADPTHQSIVVQWSDRIDAASLAAGSELTIAFDESGRSARWCYDASRLERRHVQALQRQFACLLRAAAHEPKRSVGELPLLSQGELDRVIVEWNATAGEVRSGVGVHHLVEQQAARMPDRTAITAHGVSITYAELDARANRLARRLATLGVKPDVLVGLMCDRSVEMMVGLLAIHKAGGAYVPLDPAYPRDRIAMMVEDSKLAVLLTMERLRGEVPLTQGNVIAIDGDWAAIEAESAEPFDGGALPEHLAYVIYTSGSTGRPKGVMVEHRNVVNFFAGMDRHLDADEDASQVNTWLAVTSLSFDISVLELCWPLTRGWHVVISSDEDRSAAAPQGQHAQRPIDFSLFYFSSDESEAGVDDKYRLLIEGSKYADQHGFTAVWTPERHFNAFGGLYPNPAVTGAAIATITKKVQIRSGSVVAPLHHPLRIAEEWSVVDNLSHGRVGLSFASGWHPNDFVLRPQNFKDAKKVLVDTVDTVRALWRGEARSFEGPLGPVEVRVLPRPVQKELPFWVTSAGNVETFEIAGRIGANVLTHLLGQTVEELKGKLEAYRRARREAGHEGDGIVSLMLHSFVGPDESVVRAKVKQPLIEYLRSSANLVKQYAWAFPAFKRREGMNTSVDAVDLSTVSKEEMDALLEFSFERYYEASGLFGTPERCMAMIDKLKGIGVDDVACLIDFGVDSKSVLDHLPYLNQLRKLSKPPRVMSPELALPALLARHAVTHLQCTPSMARLLLLDDAARAGLARSRRMMVGGEALQPQLAKELTGLLAAGKLMNMYGPTETTIWSAVHTLDRLHEGQVPLGRPLANQQIYILDRRQQPLPVGVPGELVIGGKGVVRGYLHRPELTAERFVHVSPGGTGAQRVYRTGDLAKFRDDGTVEFLGRLDHQVKVRGYRIELGEIEALIARRPEVSETVVVAREDTPGDVRLVAYLVAKPGQTVVAAELRESLRDMLPEFMVPGHVVVLDAMPQTPNGKIDRKQLPAPEHADEGAHAEYVAPTGDLEARIVEVWKDVLKLPKVGVRDNFFDLGGHSLLAIQLLRALKERLERDLAITDVFRFPTVQALAAHLSSDASAQGAAAKQGQDRAQGRRAAMARRQGARETTPT
jgi:natural product biosynthesis luciferase-like monooxygenase protein